MAFADQGEFEAMKTLRDRRTPSCDKHQFRTKMTVSTQTVFELLLFEQSGRNEERIRKMAFWLSHTFASSAWLLATYMSLADHKGTQRGRLGA